MKSQSRWVGVGVLVSVALGIGTAHATSNMDRIREKAEEFMVKLIETDYRHRMEGKVSGYDRVSKDFAYLFTTRKVSDIDEVIEKTTDPVERRGLEMLRSFVEKQIVFGKTASIVDEVGNFELEQQNELPGRGAVPFREAQALSLRSPDRKVRRIAYVTVTQTHEIANVYRNQIIATATDAASALGYGSYTEMRARHQGVDYEALQTFCQGFLDRTAARYEKALAEQARRVLDLAPGKVRRYDLGFLALSTEMDGALRGVEPDKIVRQLQKRLGLPSSRKVAEIDLEDDKSRSPRSDVFAIDLDRKIIAAGRPAGATADLAFKLNALGRIARDMSLGQELKFEFKRLGCRPLDLAAGYLFDGLLAEPAFATGVLGLGAEQAAALRRSRELAELIEVRIDAATFLFEQVLHEDFKMAQMKYNDHMARHLKIKFLKIDSELYLGDFEFAVVDRLVGRLLAHRLSETLQSRFGPTWWTSEAAGGFLRTVWAEGSRQTPEELAATYGLSLFDWPVESASGSGSADS